MVLMSLLTTLSEGGFYVSDSRCLLAQPSLRYDDEKPMTDLSSIGITVTDPIMVGYFQKMTGFEYIGCARASDLVNNVSPIITRKDPGACSFFCPSYFGISKTECYCLPDYNFTIFHTQVNKCVEDCDIPGIPCGNKNFLSLYRNNTTVDNTPYSETNYCLKIDSSSSKFSWQTCLKHTGGYRPLCYKNMSAPFIVQEYPLTFIKAADECFKSKSRLTLYKNSHISTPNRDELWTGVISSKAIYNTTFQQTYHPMGVLTYDSDKRSYILSFPTETIQKMKYLCNDGSSAINNEDGLPHERKKSADVGVPVGVSVAVVVIIVVVVTVLVVVKRRRKKTPNNEMETKTNKVMKEEPNEYTDIPEIKHINGNSPLRCSKVEETNNYDHTYHVLEGDRKTDSESSTTNKKTPLTESDYNYPDMTGFIQEKAKSQPSDLYNGQYAHTYFVLEEHQKDVDTVDGTYNGTGAHKPKTDLETDNVYNKLENKNLATYDHIPGSLGSDNKYSSKKNATKMLKPSEEPDSVYNHISAVEENVTYDHANIVPTVDKNPYDK